MQAPVAVQSLRPDADYATFQASSSALVTALQRNCGCTLQLTDSDAEIVQHAVAEAKAGFQDAFGTRGTRAWQLARSGYQLTSHKELFEVCEHCPVLRHPAGEAAQKVVPRLVATSLPLYDQAAA